MGNLEQVTVVGMGQIFFYGLFAFDGWNQLNFITEEIKDPMKNLPRSIYIGMPLIIVLYVLIAVSYISVLDVNTYDFAQSGGIAAVRNIMSSYQIFVSSILPARAPSAQRCCTCRGYSCY